MQGIAPVRHVFEHGLLPERDVRFSKSLRVNGLVQSVKHLGQQRPLLRRRIFFQCLRKHGKKSAKTRIMRQRPQERLPPGQTFIQPPEFINVEVQQPIVIEKIILLRLIHRGDE